MGKMVSIVANDIYNFAIDNTEDTVLCPLARHYILCLVLVQPRKTANSPNMTKKLFTYSSRINSDSIQSKIGLKIG